MIPSFPDSSPSLNIDFKAELNEQQYRAVTAPEGPSLVIAGAGSGKTRALTYRVAWLLSQGYFPGSILLLTFTNKAAREMLQRVGELAALDTAMIWGGTFHSFANRILRRHATLLDYSESFSILDSEDQRSLLGRIIREQDKTETGKSPKKSDKEKRFPKSNVLLSINSLACNTGRTLKTVLYSDFAYLISQEDEIITILNEYTRLKKESNSMDFDDLLVNAVRLLQENEDVRRYYGKKFKQVLVDEYQDTNFIQDALVDLLVRDHKNIMVVGDDAQSIYSWRGADMNHILEFPKKYPEAKMFKIETNYRSVPEILELSNEAISRNTCQFEKVLVSSRSSESGQALPVLMPCRTASTQAKFVADQIHKAITEGVDPGEIAVLYRAHYQSLDIQMELIKRKIPFLITSGIRFFEQAHIKDIIAFLRFIANPRDELSFNRMISLVPGVGPVTRNKLWNAWLKIAGERNFALPTRFSEEWHTFPVPKKAQNFWMQLLYTLDELVSESDDQPAPGEMIKSVFLGVYEECLQTAFDDVEQRAQDINQLVTFSGQFENLADFLSQLSLMSATDAEQKTENAVTLSSIHQAKGLEWHTVFVIWLADGMFPHQKCLEAQDQRGLEEERRLFYVAVTRAKDKLYLTYPVFNSSPYAGDFSLSPSCFLSDFPAELIDEWPIK